MFRLNSAYTRVAATRERRRRWLEAGRCLERSSVAVNPHRVIHIRLSVGVRHRAVIAAVVSVSEQEYSATGLIGVIAVADQQYTVAVIDGIRRTHLEHVVGPFGMLGPA